jgi:hypothetical protein
MEKLQQLFEMNTQVLHAINVRGASSNPPQQQHQGILPSPASPAQSLPVAIPQAQPVPVPQPALPQAHAFIVTQQPPSLAAHAPPLAAVTTATHPQFAAHSQPTSGTGEISRKPSSSDDLWQQSMTEKEKVFVRLQGGMGEMKKEVEVLHKMYREEVQGTQNMQQRLQMLEARLSEETVKNTILQEKLDKAEAK